MDSAIEKNGTQLFLLNNNHMAWSVVGKYEQASTYASWKIPLYQNYKR